MFSREHVPLWRTLFCLLHSGLHSLMDAVLSLCVDCNSSPLLPMILLLVLTMAMSTCSPIAEANIIKGTVMHCAVR